MCGRYYLRADDEDYLDEHYRRIDSGSAIGIRGRDRDIFPSDEALLLRGIRGGHDTRPGYGGIGLDRMVWGYPANDRKGLVINARAESVLNRPMFSHGIQYSRAVIPAAGFYEWNQQKEKFTFTLADASTMYMAGFYDFFEDQFRFVILTTAANASMAPVHDRMPLILPPDQLEDWILDDNSVKSILKQTPVMLDKKTDYEQMSLF